jgi:hypothetical protein
MGAGWNGSFWFVREVLAISLIGVQFYGCYVVAMLMLKGGVNSGGVNLAATTMAFRVA